jgi:putative flippase GtrA
MALSHQENVRCCGYKIHNYFWFMLSGFLCDIVQGLIDYGVFLIYWLPYERATVCWTVSYTLSIIVRHVSHRYIVFGEYEGSYCASLCRTYATYSSSIVISTISNHYFINYLLLSHRDAWVITMLWTGVYNYFMLKKSWRQKDKDEASREGAREEDKQSLLEMGRTA